MIQTLAFQNTIFLDLIISRNIVSLYPQLHPKDILPPPTAQTYHPHQLRSEYIHSKKDKKFCRIWRSCHQYTSDSTPPPHPTSTNFSPSNGLALCGSFLQQRGWKEENKEGWSYSSVITIQKVYDNLNQKLWNERTLKPTVKTSHSRIKERQLFFFLPSSFLYFFSFSFSFWRGLCCTNKENIHLKWWQSVERIKASLVGFRACNGLYGPSASHLVMTRKSCLIMQTTMNQ